VLACEDCDIIKAIKESQGFGNWLFGTTKSKLKKDKVYKDQTLKKICLLPCFDFEIFPFFLAIKDHDAVIVNCQTGNITPLIQFRQLHPNDEISDFDFTFTVIPESVGKIPTARDLQQVVLHYKEDLYDKQGNFLALHYVQLVLDQDDLAIFTEFSGEIPDCKKELIKLLESQEDEVKQLEDEYKKTKSELAELLRRHPSYEVQRPKCSVDTYSKSFFNSVSTSHKPTTTIEEMMTSTINETSGF
jgi:hypothetical protein